MPLLDDHDAVGLAALVRSGSVSPLELVDEAIARIEEVNPALNAVIHRQYERARAEASNGLPDGPLRGVPFLLKDYKGREAGEPYYMGNRALRDVDYRPRSNSPLALAFRAAGLVPLGRTNVPEMASMAATEPAIWGPTHNPWKHGYSPGGSSGGSAAAVAAGLVPVAHANDISGSIRIPAAHCGLVGLKPTRGRTIASDIDPPVGMNAEGVLSRSVRDTAAVLDTVLYRSPWWPAPALLRPLSAEVGAPVASLRVGLWTNPFNGVDCDAACREAAESCGRLLESLGHRIEVAAPREFSLSELWDTARTAMQATIAAEADAWTGRLGRQLGEEDVEPNTWDFISAGRALSAPAILAAIGQMQNLAAGAATWWDRFDILVTPTTASPPDRHGEYLRNYQSGKGSAFTRPINVTGQPAISLPLGWPDDGLPRGVMLTAAYGRDDLLIRLASSLETAAPWSHRRPPVHA